MSGSSYAPLFTDVRKAIVLPYVVGQHEPSTPLRQLVDVDMNKLDEECHKLFLEVFEAHYVDTTDKDSLTLLTNGDSPYGDVSYGNDDLFIFLTFIEEANDGDGEEDFEDWGSIGPPS